MSTFQRQKQEARLTVCRTTEDVSAAASANKTDIWTAIFSSLCSGFLDLGLALTRLSQPRIVSPLSYLNGIRL